MWFSIGFLFVGDFFPWLLCWFGFCLILLGVLFPIFNLKYIMREKLYYFLLLLKASILSTSSSSFYALVNDIFFSFSASWLIGLARQWRQRLWALLFVTSQADLIRSSHLIAQVLPHSDALSISPLTLPPLVKQPSTVCCFLNICFEPSRILFIYFLALPLNHIFFLYHILSLINF